MWNPIKENNRYLFVSLFILLFGMACVAPVEARVRHITTAEGITLHLDLPQLMYEEEVLDGVTYQHVSYAGCGYLSEPGMPKVPVTRVMLGVPPRVNVEVADVSAAPMQTRGGIRLSRVPGLLARQTSANRIPASLARIVADGYIRSQRVVVLELAPVQYLVQARQLQTYASLTVNLHFRLSGKNTGSPSAIDEFPGFSALQGPVVKEPAVFEEMLSRLLLNAEAAAPFRMPRRAAVAAAVADGAASTRYKIFVEHTGVHVISAESLRRDFDIDVIGTNPMNFRMWHGSREVPLYINGAQDGRFDAHDTIFFLGQKTDNPYTRWNIYWLTQDGRGTVPPARVPNLNAGPADPTATQVPSFRAIVNFEADRLTSNLEFVKPDAVSPGNKHGWFDALDFWYWDGIKNGGDSGEMRLEVPLYDVAKSFDPPKIHVELQGGTPVDHEILVAFNGVRIDVAKWEEQDTLTLERTFRTWETLKDLAAGEYNVFSLARVDSTFEEDTTRYPYHVYVNRFSVEYTRLFKAVGDRLWLRTPSRADAESRPGRKLQYRVESFIAPDVHVFETDGANLTAKLSGLSIKEKQVERTERDRWQHLITTDTLGQDAQIPSKTYTVTFQVSDARTTQFIAISSAALLQPVRVALVQPSELTTSSHGADYLIVTHPKFNDAAETLAAWRATPSGGGYRTKVVSTDDIYNTFGDGQVHPEAIKTFFTHVYHTWEPPAPTYVVLFGDATFDFRGIDTSLYPEPPQTDGYIPTHYIHTDSFGRTSSDHWYATVSGYDSFTDFYIGRLSAETTSEAITIVDKIIGYEQRAQDSGGNRREDGEWRRKIISVADDEVSNSGDFIFKKSLDEIAKNHTLLGYETVEVFLEDVIDEVEARPGDFPGLLPQRVAKNRIIDALNEGAVIAQYAGHGGRIGWAHEAIFDNASIDLLEETPNTPFMLVLSCYNGYFDKPGEPSIAEKFLRKPRGGIIGMLSATRLTYAGGNDALNRIIFDMVFKRNVAQLGPLSFDSKVELLITEGTGQIDVMMEYTLFGDPALRIALPEYELRPEILTKTVTPGDTLRIAAGSVQNVQYDQQTQSKQFTRNTDFEGTLTVKALFPGKSAIGQGVAGPVEYYTGDVIVTQTVPVTGGTYPAVNITVPHNIASGDAHVEYAAESRTTADIAVGGDAFTVDVPKILDIRPELVGDDTFSISVEVSDDAAEQLAAVTLEWRNPETRQWAEVALIPKESSPNRGWWTVPEPLPAPTDGAVIRYQISVTDTDGNSVKSDNLRYYPYVYPNLSVVEVSREVMIWYHYSNTTNQWQLSADLQWVGGDEQTSVSVSFFSGNPDLNEDGVIDSEANQIGVTRVNSADWVQRNPLKKNGVYPSDPLNINPIATATIVHQLRRGTHDIFVVIDAPGTVTENDEEDNVGYRRIHVESGVVGQQPRQIPSLDGNCVITAPPNVLDTEAVVAIRALGSSTDSEDNAAHLQPVGSLEKSYPSVFRLQRAPLPGDVFGYDIALPDGELLSRLKTPVTVDLNLDMATLREQLRQELLGVDVTHGGAQEEVLDVASTVAAAVTSRAQETGIYLWSTPLGNWTRLESQTLSQDGTVQMKVTHVSAQNTGGGRLQDVRIHSEGARIGKWVLLWKAARSYRLLLAPTERADVDDTDADAPLVEIEHSLETVDAAQQIISFSPEYPTFSNGIALDIEPEASDPFAFGDVLSFRITELPDLSADENVASPQWYASSFRSGNQGSGSLNYIRLEPDTAMPEDRWVLLFVTETEFQLEGEKTGILRGADGMPYRGESGIPFEYAPYGLNLLVTQGERPFSVGDSFRFQTRPVRTLRATTDILGPVTLLHSDDTVPPDIQLTVSSQQHFVTGDATGAEPVIGATLTDDSGLDYITRPVTLELGTPGGVYEPIAPDTYQLTQVPGSTQLVLTYASPKLEPGEYSMRLTASDVHGNIGEADMTFKVYGNLQLVSFLNYPNPFEHSTKLTCELTAPADSIDIKIYTLSGRLIRTLSLLPTAGFLMEEWDGRDADGVEVANGVYYAKIRIQPQGGGDKEITEILKMLKLR